MMPKITPFLWFDNNAEEAIEFYLSLFKNSRTVEVNRREDGTVSSGTFILDGQQFHALNGGPHFSFTPAISLFISCEDQAEVDLLWEKLSEGGEPLQCGWVKDKFGLSWQVIPSVLSDYLNHEDADKSERAWKAMMQMTKIDIQALKDACA